MKKNLSNQVFRIVSVLAMVVIPVSVSAQKASDFMKAMKVSDCIVPFDVDAPGTEYKVNWGMDTAWDWDYNVNLGIAHVGVGNFSYGRISFQPTDLVGDDLQLSAKQIAALQSRINHIKSTGVTDVLLNNDTPDDQKDSYRANYQHNAEAYYRVIKATVMKATELGVNVVAIAPLNEPDYVYNEQGTKDDFLAIAKLLKADSYFDGIRICGGNTLNCTEAISWYDYLSDYLDEGNTHQLAGSFADYATFFTKVKNDGKVATADELHNVGEAIVGVHYGMENGIWWAFDSKARGQFCLDSNEGVCIGYGENRNAWTNAAVYRNEKTGEVHGYFGSSERQAAASTIQYISTSKDVYFNGYGPTRSFIYNVPAGTGAYQYGQINAERLFDIAWGEDVPPAEVDGKYVIMNAYSKKMLTYMGSSNVQSSTRKSSGTTQQWNVYPVYVDAAGEVKKNADNEDYVSYGDGVFGDVSYWFIDYAGSSAAHLNVLNNSLDSGAGVICYNAGHGTNEQWYVKYVKDGYYFIISRLSNKYLHCNSSTTGANVTLVNAPAEGISESNLKKYLWRFQPTDSKAETSAPAPPTNLQARQRIGSIQISWIEATDSDPLTYTVLRKENGEWNTIGRNISGSTFIDNNVRDGVEYQYKVKSVDYAGNRSADSDILSARPLSERALLCQLQFDGTLSDNSANSLDASIYGNEKYTTLSSLRKSGTNALNLSSADSYLQIPHALTHQSAMTISMWARWDGTASWQRIFDFGNGTDSYMFLTPSNGSQMRFVMKNGGDEEILSTSTFPKSSFRHLAITIAPTGNGLTSATIYINGELVATKADFTISPADISASVAYIGRSMFPADPLFKGYLDDFRIYNYALTAEEVAALISDTGEVSKDIIDTYEDTLPTSISNPAAESSDAAPGTIYNVAGQAVPSDYKGIVIKNNTKVIQ